MIVVIVWVNYGTELADKMSENANETAEELYEEYFTVTDQETEDVHFYIKDGTLYLDEYAETGEYDEEGLAVYEWRRNQKIADNVIFIDYNWYKYGTNALYITEDHTFI